MGQRVCVFNVMGRSKLPVSAEGETMGHRFGCEGVVKSDFSKISHSDFERRYQQASAEMLPCCVASLEGSAFQV